MTLFKGEKKCQLKFLLMMGLLLGTTPNDRGQFQYQNYEYVYPLTQFPTSWNLSLCGTWHIYIILHNDHTRTFIAMFIRAKDWKQPDCPFIGDQLNKFLYIHTMHQSTASKQGSSPSTNMDSSSRFIKFKKEKVQYNMLIFM